MKTLTQRLADVPLKRKVTIISMLSSGVALLLACTAFVTYELVTFKDALVADMYSHGALIAHNSAAALLFDDPVSAERTLESFSTQPQVLGAALYDRSGKLFAAYAGATAEDGFDAPSAAADGHRFEGNRLKLFHSFDVAGEPAGTVYIEADIESVRERLARYGLIGLLVLLLASGVAFLLSTRLQRTISEPISALAAIVHDVRASQDYSLRATKLGNDELGELIDGFNAMLHQIESQARALRQARHTLERRVVERTELLEREIAGRESAQAQLHRTHDELVRASRQAGMAEVATNVLHNVGNVLNSVNVAVGVLTEQIKHSRLTNLQKVAALCQDQGDRLGDFLASDPRGKRIPAYMVQLAEHLLAERTAALAELDSLRGNVEHIKGIVTVQQNYAKVGGVNEPTSVVDVLEDAVQMTNASLHRHDVEVVRDYADVPALDTEKHKVLQILVNLIRNAKDACAATGREDKQITLRVRDEGGCVRVSVIDNGIGIAPENLTRVFAHGFTTKKDGHGFGLHSGALAARELGGALTLASEGPNRGATFTLELPIRDALAANDDSSSPPSMAATCADEPRQRSSGMSRERPFARGETSSGTVNPQVARQY
ncbi:MAG TPA: ATP-binding protein [Gammaproteobacteria bacterium]|nr:ATP-binding protein [Gammaproteobacteria bacterium]